MCVCIHMCNSSQFAISLSLSLFLQELKNMEREEQKSTLNSPLIQISSEEINNNHQTCSEKKKIIEEVKRQLWLSGPLISVSLLQFCLQMISVMFVGHLGELPLSGASMATSFATVTGFSFLVSLVNFFCYILF